MCVAFFLYFFFISFVFGAENSRTEMVVSYSVENKIEIFPTNGFGCVLFIAHCMRARAFGSSVYEISSLELP